MCAHEAICVPRFLAIFLKHPLWRLVLMWGFPSSDEWGLFSRSWEISFSFAFPDFTSTCGEQPFSQVKVWGDSGKIAIILRNLIHTKLLQMTKEPSMDNDRQQYIFMFVYIHCFNWISRLEIRLLSGFASI